MRNAALLIGEIVEYLTHCQHATEAEEQEGVEHQVGAHVPCSMAVSHAHRVEIGLMVMAANRNLAMIAPTTPQNFRARIMSNHSSSACAMEFSIR